MNKERNWALDMMKFVATIMIVNSHFIPLYKDINIGLATFGVHGNALFFYVAGFLLTMNMTNKKERFDNWYKRRIRRIFPALLIWYLIALDDFGGGSFLQIWSKYWFISCIFIYYFIFYFYERFIIYQSKIIRSSALFVPILISVLFAFFMEKAEGSVFHTDWHYMCHFSIMVMGGLAFKHFEKRALACCQRKDWYGLIISFVLYFVIIYLGKGKTDWHYYLQLICLIPLHTFCWYCYKVCSGQWCKKLFSNKVLKLPFTAISALTLEIYIVQFAIITDKFNNLFPLSLIIVFFFICITAYTLHIMTNFFLQLLDKEPWKWKSVLQLV